MTGTEKVSAAATDRVRPAKPAFGDRRSVVGRLLALSDKRLLAVAVVASVLNALVTMALLIQIKDAITDATRFDPVTGSFFLAALMAGILVTQMTAAQALLLQANKALAKLRRRLAARIAAAPYSTLEGIGSDRIYAVVSGDVPMIHNALFAIPAMLTGISVCLLGTAYMAYVSPPHLLVALGAASIGLMVSEALLSPRIQAHVRKVRGLMDDLFKQFGHIVFGAKETKLNAFRQAHTLRAFVDIAEGELYEASNRKEFLGALYGTWSMLTSFIVICVVVVFDRFVLSLPLGDILSIIIILFYLRAPLISVVNAVPAFIGARVAFEHVDGLELRLDSEAPPAEAPASPSRWRRLELRDVAYSYPRPDGAACYSFSVGPVSFAVEPGEIVFIVGGNGSGKSTFAKLLSGLYRPSSGEILVDGEPVTDADADRLRNRFAAVFSDYHLFDGVLDEHGQPPDSDRVRELLRRFELDSVVDYRDGRFGTTRLSAGQRKRLALVSAILEGKSLLLLDEWAADQDPSFRALFYREILPELKGLGYAVVAITHDDHYFDAADRIYRMDQGLLTETGPLRPGAQPWPVTAALPASPRASCDKVA